MVRCKDRGAPSGERAVVARLPWLHIASSLLCSVILTIEIVKVADSSNYNWSLLNAACRWHLCMFLCDAIRPIGLSLMLVDVAFHIMKIHSAAKSTPISGCLRVSFTGNIYSRLMNCNFLHSTLYVICYSTQHNHYWNADKTFHLSSCNIWERVSNRDRLPEFYWSVIASSRLTDPNQLVVKNFYPYDGEDMHQCPPPWLRRYGHISWGQPLRCSAKLSCIARFALHLLYGLFHARRSKSAWGSDLQRFLSAT